MEDFVRHQRKEPKENARLGALGADGYFSLLQFGREGICASRKSKGWLLSWYLMEATLRARSAFDYYLAIDDLSKPDIRP